MSSPDQAKGDSLLVDEIMHLSPREQANEIAKNFCKLESSDIDLTQAANVKPTPILAEHKVYEYLKKIKRIVQQLIMIFRLNHPGICL